jgi:hypothetical protein
MIELRLECILDLSLTRYREQRKQRLNGPPSITIEKAQAVRSAHTNKSLPKLNGPPSITVGKARQLVSAHTEVSQNAPGKCKPSGDDPAAHNDPNPTRRHPPAATDRSSACLFASSRPYKTPASGFLPPSPPFRPRRPA